MSIITTQHHRRHDNPHPTLQPRPIVAVETMLQPYSHPHAHSSVLSDTKISGSTDHHDRDGDRGDGDCADDDNSCDNDDEEHEDEDDDDHDEEAKDDDEKAVYLSLK